MTRQETCGEVEVEGGEGRGGEGGWLLLERGRLSQISSNGRDAYSEGALIRVGGGDGCANSEIYGTCICISIHFTEYFFKNPFGQSKMTGVLTLPGAVNVFVLRSFKRL